MKTHLAPFSAHSISKRIPPRKKKKYGERKRGEGGAPERSGGAGAAFESHHGLQCVQFSIASPRARRVAGHSVFLLK